MLNEQENSDPASRSRSRSTSGNEFSEAKNENPVFEITSEGNGSSAKQHRKMKMEGTQAEGIRFSYSWTQTEADVAVTIKLKGFSDEQTRAFDVSFTSKEVTIKAVCESHVIHFYDSIQKEESRVQAKKGSIILRVLKQTPGWWPELEAASGVNGSGSKSQQTHTSEMNGHSGDTANGSGLPNSSIASDLGLDEDQDIVIDIKEKEEEPVYRLSHLKHDFYERGLQLTLSVFTKSLNKDAVKVSFSRQGFVMKFQTSDAKFLQLHQGTSSETAFTWPVTTRQEIVAEECKFTVKTSVVEIILKKTSPERWASLEAPLRKEKTDKPQSDTSWIPISNGTSSFTALNSTTPPSEGRETTVLPSQVYTAGSSKVLPPEDSSLQFGGSADRPSRVMFDDSLNDINVNLKTGAGPSISSFYRDQQEEEDDDDEDDNATSISFDYSQKPMAKVSPLNNQHAESGMVISPGYAGLVNIGNTCFMNSVIQVLANTREFRDFFLDGRFQHDINEDNPLGMKGQLAATFGVLLRWLWSCKKSYWDPRRLKDLVSKKNPQFFGYAQHDAHEFLAFLLDGLHEDLNRIRKKPYTETIDSNGRPDKVVAEEAWAQYKLRNDSVVVDMFQGQLKSKLVCPRCSKVSITFDPFLYMSVPIPKKKKVIPVHFVWKESYKKPVKYLIHVNQDSNVERLKEELSTRTRVRSCDIRVFEAYRGRILKFFISGTPLSNVEQKDVIVACEVLSEDVAGEEVIEIPVMQRTLFPSDYPSYCAFCRKPYQEGSPLKRCTKCYKVGYCDHSCQRNHWNSHKSVCSTCPDPIGCPFILSVPASRATYSYLVKHMEEFARYSVDVFQPPVKNGSSTPSVSPEVLLTPGPPVSSMKAGTTSPIVGPPPAPSAAPSSLLAGVPSLNPMSNLSSCSLSQSCSSLNSLDSLSSASSTCTLTGENSDTAISGAGESEAANPPRYASPLPHLGAQAAYDGLTVSDTADVNPSGSVDSGFESFGSTKSGERAERSIPTGSVLGVQAADTDRDRAMPTFYIKPVSMEGIGLKGADRLEDKGDVPLELTTGRFLSMDWRNNERLSSYVLVQSKDLESVEVDNLNNLTASSSKCNLYNCLELFTEPEVLSPEEAWYCPSCKKHVEASKQMSIWKLPHTLVIQLKRFSFQNFLMRSKIKKHIEFPTRGLDLSSYCVGHQPGDPPPIYDLYGVANHHGMLIGGHYTSYVRCSGLGAGDEIGWRLCNDSRVTPAACDKSVVTPDAYLLFYRRRCPAIIGRSVSQETPVPSADYIQGSHQPLAASSKLRTRYGSGDDEDDDGSDKDSVEDLYSRPKDLHGFAKKSSNINLNAQIQRQVVSGSYGLVDTTRASRDAINLQNRNNLMSASSSSAQAGSNFLQRQDGRYDSHCPTGDGDSDVEKMDAEKDSWDCEKGAFAAAVGHTEEDDDYDDDEEDRGLVIVTEPDLGYTDMEAVD